MKKKTDKIVCYYCGNRFTLEQQAKDYEYTRCPECLSTRNSMYHTSGKSLYASEKKTISPATTTPPHSEGVVSGGNVPPYADVVTLVDHRPSLSAWSCLPTEARTGKPAVVRVSPEAIIQPEYGWICDFCCRWTFGDDAAHKPLKDGSYKQKGGRR